VPYPKADEVISLTGHSGDTIDLGFNPKNTEFTERDGNLIAVRPDGRVTIFEGFAAALDSDTPPILLVNGKPLATAEILAARDAELQILPAGEDEAPAEDPAAGGTSAYGEDLDPQFGETETSLAGSKRVQGTLDSGPTSESAGEDGLFDYELESSTTKGSSGTSSYDNLLPSGKVRNGHGKGGKKKAADSGNDNQAPTDLELSNDAVPENSPAGSLVGTITAVDPNVSESFTYRLTDDAGGRFAVDQKTGAVTVSAGAELDFETAASHEISVRVTDSSGLSYDETFTLAVKDVNEAPTDILLGTDVDENVPNGTLVKTAVAIDPDANETFLYELTDDAGGRFTIDGVRGDVTVADGTRLDYEAADSHEITIQVTDSGGETYQETFTVHINDVNEAPTDLNLSGNSVLENSAAGSLVGTVTALDLDQGDGFAFSLTDSADGRFTIDHKTGAVTVADGNGLDFESAANHDISVRVTDSGGLSYDETFSISVLDQGEGGDNGTPEAIALDNLSVDENTAGALIGSLSVDDPDAGDSHTFSVDDDRFEIADGQLKLKDGIALDHETEDQVDVTVTATDSGGLAVSETFTLAVADVNEAPTDILLGTDVDENAANGTLVKVAVAIDPDDNESFHYELTDDAGGRFTIDSVNGDVTVADGTLLDYEAADSHEITIQVTDSGGETYRETFTVHINDVNEAPTDLSLSGNSVLENSAAGTLVGTVTALDPDQGDDLTFELVDNPDGPFTGEIRVADGALMDFEAKASHTVTVRVTDRGGLVYDEDFIITVQDLPEGGDNSAPTDIAVDNLSVDENAAGMVIGQISVSDLDIGDSHSLTVDDDRFEVVGDLLKLKDGASLNFEQESQVLLQLTATDSEGLSYSETVTLTVGDVNDAPVAGDDAAVVHFEATAGDPVTETWQDDFSGDWTNRWPLDWVESNALHRTSTFQQDGETWLRVTYPEGQVGRGFKFATDHAPQERVFLEYDIRFAADFDWVLGGKLPGLYGGTGNSGGDKPNGEDGWSVRFMWLQGGAGIAYVYHPDMPGTWGENMHFDGAQFQKGVVQTLGLEVVMNTPGQNDGVIRAWLDGVLVVERTDMRWRDIPDLQIDGITFSTFFGGGTAEWAPSKDETIDFGDFKLYDAPPSEGGQIVSADPVTLDLLDDDTDQDGDPLSLVDLDQPNSGTVTDNGDGTVSYQPDESFSLYDSFFYAVADGAGGESTALARIWDDSLNPVSGTVADETLNGTSGGDYMAGGDGDDTLYGQGGDDVLLGGAGSDSLDGGPGNDVLIGGAGADTIDVSEGVNLVIYESVLDGGDTINGFNAAVGHDTISLDLLFDRLGVATADRAGRIEVEKNGDTHTVRVDTTGDGAFDLMVATVNAINGNILDVRQEDNDVTYGTLG
jgi:hypothetical protein